MTPDLPVAIAEGIALFVFGAGVIGTIVYGLGWLIFSQLDTKWEAERKAELAAKKAELEQWVFSCKCNKTGLTKFLPGSRFCVVCGAPRPPAR